jgi:hypothetical protein
MPSMSSSYAKDNCYLATQLVAQFDMPDPTPVAEACGVILHKR